MLPKVNSARDLDCVSREIYSASALHSSRDAHEIRLVASIESAKSLFNLGSIASWQSEHGPLHGGKLSVLLVSVLSSRSICKIRHVSSSPQKTVSAAQDLGHGRCDT